MHSWQRLLVAQWDPYQREMCQLGVVTRRGESGESRVSADDLPMRRRSLVPARGTESVSPVSHRHPLTRDRNKSRIIIRHCADSQLPACRHVSFDSGTLLLWRASFNVVCVSLYEAILIFFITAVSKTAQSIDGSSNNSSQSLASTHYNFNIRLKLVALPC